MGFILVSNCKAFDGIAHDAGLSVSVGLKCQMVNSCFLARASHAEVSSVSGSCLCATPLPMGSHQLRPLADNNNNSNRNGTTTATATATATASLLRMAWCGSPREIRH